VKEKFGTREKLIGAILELTKRGKDEGYKSSLSKHPVPRLYDLYKSTAKRQKDVAEAAKAKAEAKPAAKKPAAAAAKNAPAKKAAATKTAAKKAPAKKAAAKKK